MTPGLVPVVTLAGGDRGVLAGRGGAVIVGDEPNGPNPGSQEASHPESSHPESSHPELRSSGAPSPNQAIFAPQ